MNSWTAVSVEAERHKKKSVVTLDRRSVGKGSGIHMLPGAEEMVRV